MKQYGVEFAATDKEEADGALAKRRLDLPLVNSAYAPSGIMPAAALPWMFAGALGGGIIAVAAGLALVGGAWAVTIGMYIVWEQQGKPVNMILLIGSLVLGGVLTLAAAIGPGVIVAKATAAGGRRGKNRNPLWASVLAGATAAAVALAVYWFWHRPGVLDSLHVLDRFDSIRPEVGSGYCAPRLGDWRAWYGGGRLWLRA